MALIRDSNSNGYILRDYCLEKVMDRESSLRWLAAVILNTEIDIERINFYDFNSVQDSVVFNTLIRVDDVNIFVDAYIDSLLKSISIVGKYRGSPFNLGVNLDSGYIGLCFKIKDQLDCESLERLLGLT